MNVAAVGVSVALWAFWLALVTDALTRWLARARAILRDNREDDQ